MEYRILGPLEVIDNGKPLDLSGARQRTLLAFLLLRRNEVVSADRLIDALWGEHPPASAHKALQNAVLQVRRALGDGAGALRTRGGGYVLEVADGELDAHRFGRLAAEGRAALTEGDAERAAARLRDALGVWRGPALADLDHDVFAAAEVRRLDEERLAVTEDRIEADLALGHEAQLVGELEEAVTHHPLRERLRVQLMLALYAQGRQADALAVFHDARRVLDDELGIEPGRELRETHDAVLQQDPELARPRMRTARPPVRVRARLIGAAGALLLLAVAAAGVVLATDDDEEGARDAGIASVPGNSLVAIDPASARMVATHPVGSTPTSVASGADETWTLNADDATLTRVSTQTSRGRTFALPAIPLDVAVGENAVWALAGSTESPQGPNVPTQLFEIEPATGAVRREVDLPSGSSAEWIAQDRLAVGTGPVWALAADDQLVRLDPAGGSPRAVRGIHAAGVAADGDAAWAIVRTPESHRVVRISAAGRVTRRVPVATTELDGIAAGGGSVWATAPQDGLLWRITPDGTRSIDVGAGVRGVTYADDAVWVTNAPRGTVSRVDPASNRVTATVRIGNAPRDVAFDGERVWVSVAEAGGAPAQDTARTAVGAVTASACSDVIAGAEAPERLIVSDLPLQQPGLSALADAVAFVLRRRGFRAGEFSLGYQSCDDSTAKAGSFEIEKCRANAELYARTPRVVGIIGPYNSDCAAVQLAITNRAPGGPLATVSPTNTFLELTKPVPGTDGRATEALYPTGRRHYVRLWGTDDGQGTVLARFAHKAGVERLAIVGDADGYGIANSHYAEREAVRLGMEVLGPYELDPERSPARARRLAARILRARPDALLMAGVPFFGPPGKALPAFELVREVAGRAAPDPLLLGTDAWAWPDGVFGELGPLARKLHVVYPALPVSRLPAPGRLFVEEFGATQPGGIVSEEAVYVAQATEVLLDAITRSDGTRTSVSEALFATRLEDAFVGDVAFDAEGDVEPSPFTIFRLRRGIETPQGIASDGGNIAAVITP